MTNARDNKHRQLNIGIYGGTFAGKTRFIYELLVRWRNDNRILSSSENCQTFLCTVAEDMKQYGHPRHTEATIEGITAKVRRDKGERPWELMVRDLRGEILIGELEKLDSVARDGMISTQVKECDVFLYFFDPTSAEHKDLRGIHHDNELKRAELFIEYALSSRENRYLPVIFIETRRDEWENDSEMRRHADQWFTDVNDRLQQHYRLHLQHHYPPSFVERKRTSIAISNIQNTEALEQVIERANELVEDGVKYADKSRHKSRRLAIAAGLVALAFGCIIFGTWLVSHPGGRDRADKDRGLGDHRDPKEAVERLQSLIDTHPPGDRLLPSDKAREFNKLLSRLISMLDGLDARTPPSDSSGSIRGDIESVVSRAGKLIRTRTERKSDNLPPSEYVETLTMYLNGLPAAGSTPQDIIAAQENYWKLQRQMIVQQLADILKRREAVASSPSESLGETISAVKTLRQTLQQCRVGTLQSRQRLLEELNVVETFCEDRRKERSYPVEFKVVSVSYTGDGKDRNSRALTLESPGQTPWVLSLRSASSGDFKTEKASYREKLGLGGPIICSLAVCNPGSDTWDKLQDFDLSVPPDVPSLNALGMAFLRPEQRVVPQKLMGSNHKLNIEVSSVVDVPALLGDAAKRCYGVNTNDH